MGFVLARGPHGPAQISESWTLAPTTKVDCILAGSNEKYIVVGVRADGSRHVLSLRLSLEDARYVQRVLLKADIFPAVLIQVGDPSAEAADEARPVNGGATA